MPPIFSVITSTRDGGSEDLAWHRRLSSDRVETIIIENAGRCGLGQAYNEGLQRAQGEYCCFIHDDVRVWSPNWLYRLAQVVTEDAFDLVGVAGTTKMPRSGGWWDSGRGYGRGTVAHLHPDGRILLDDYGPPDDHYRGLSPVVSLDGLLLFGRRRDFELAPFDTTFFDGFHFYDSDLSLRWLLWHNKRLAVVHGLDVVHRAGATLTGWQPFLNRFHHRHGGFLPLSVFDVELWRDNLAALRHRDPGAADRLTAWRRPGLILGFKQVGERELFAVDEQREIEIHDEPLTPDLDRDKGWIVVQGAGTGDSIDRLLRDDERPILVVEPQAHLVCWLLCRFHWAEEIYSGRLRWLIPAVDQPAIAEVSLHELIGGLQEIATDRGPPLWIGSGSRKLHETFHESVRAAVGLPAESRIRSTRWPTGTASAAITVISPRCRIFDDLAQSLVALGCPTRRIDVPDRPDEWNRTKSFHVLRQLREQATPVTLLRNRVLLETSDPRLRLGLDRLVPGRVVSWWWDEPTVSTLLDLRDPSCRRPALAFARGLLSKLPPGSRWLPPAARMEFARDPLAENDSGRDWPISFVGQSRWSLVRENLGILANGLAYFDGRIGWQLAREVNAVSSMRGQHQALARLKDEMTEAIARVRRSLPAVAIYLDYLWQMCLTGIFRLAAVEQLGRSGLVVVGDDGWVESGAVPRERFAGLVAPAQLAGIYRRSRVNLNLNFMQVSTTVNPKVLDITAGGNGVLTDHRPELDEIFPLPAARPPSFRTIEELPDRVAELLRGDDAPKRIETAQHVRAHHLMIHRAAWIAREYDLPMTSREFGRPNREAAS